jgi:hypothetical protein
MAMTSTRPSGLISLVPHSGIQFLDIDFDMDRLPRGARVFWEETLREQVDHEGKSPVILRVLEPDADGNLADPVTRQVPPPEETYAISRAQALEPFLNKWIPLPYFRVHARGGDGREVYDRGPSNWVRAYIAEKPQRDSEGRSHRLVLAFDTALMERTPQRPYVAPSPEDSARQQEFAPVLGHAENAWFLNEAWVGQWLEECFRELRQAQRGGRPLRPEDFPHACEHWARYLALLGLFEGIGILPRVRLVDVVSENRGYAPIHVDLVLDIGNSRTCGVLVEENQDTPSLNNSQVLALRDLSRPEHVYSRPFESRVEFAMATFGRDAISRRSGRANAFRWPSPVRVGPEAMRLAAETEGNEGATGISSPKRYLWDRRPNVQGWRFNGRASDGVTTEPPVSGPFMAHVTETGEVLRTTRGRGQPAVRARFSRSAMFTFLLAELLMQAISQINAWATRAARRFADVPRRLRRVILTLPPAMPLAEQKILRERAEGAVKLAWDLLGWTEAGPTAPPEPRVLLNLDEATATQVVWLYTEITQRLQGDAAAFFELAGRVRPERGPSPCLRVASIDIGGGTTDLMIVTWSVENRDTIVPRQEFREGFKIAGDEVLEGLITHLVLPQVAAALRGAGMGDPDAFLRQMLGGDRGGQSEVERHLRRQFVAQVLEPVALAVLHAYERIEGREMGEIFRASIGAVLAAEPQPANARAIAFFETAARQAGAQGFAIADVEVAADARRVEAVVQATLGPVLADLCEVVWHYDCDVLLLSGRPSRLRVVTDMVLAKLPVPPHRIIGMHRYQVGGWYPFRDAHARIDDPKTSAAVGAMLCALAEGRLEGFLMRTSQLQMKSTARYIGRMEISGQIRDQGVLLADVDLEKRPATREAAEFTMTFAAPTFLGFRQLPIERWPATPLYALEFANPESVPRMALPLRLKIRRADLDPDAPGQEERREDFRIEEIEDAEGTAMRRTDVEIRLQTMKSEAGYWRDTGIVGMA